MIPVIIVRSAYCFFNKSDFRKKVDFTIRYKEYTIKITIIVHIIRLNINK